MQETIPKHLWLGTATTSLLRTNTKVSKTNQDPCWNRNKQRHLRWRHPPCHSMSSASPRHCNSHCNQRYPHATLSRQWLKTKTIFKVQGTTTQHLIFAHFRNKVTFIWGKSPQPHQLLWLMPIILLITSRLVKSAKKEWFSWSLSQEQLGSSLQAQYCQYLPVYPYAASHSP